jgi:hypothetical protein
MAGFRELTSSLPSRNSAQPLSETADSLRRSFEKLPFLGDCGGTKSSTPRNVVKPWPPERRQQPTVEHADVQRGRVDDGELERPLRGDVLVVTLDLALGFAARSLSGPVFEGQRLVDAAPGHFPPRRRRTSRLQTWFWRRYLGHRAPQKLLSIELHYELLSRLKASKVSSGLTACE